MEMAFTMHTVIIFLVCALFFQHISGQFLRPGNNGNVPQNVITTGQSNCNYILSFGTGGTCVVTTKDVDKKFNLIMDDLSRTKLQFIAQNSILQTQLTNLSRTDRNLALQVDGLKRDLQALKSRVQVPTVNGPSTGSNVNVNQIQSSLTNLINGLDQRLTSLALNHQRDAVAAAQTDSAIQQQLTQLSRDNQQLKSTVSTLTLDMNTLKQNYARDLQQLTTQIRAIAAASTLPGKPAVTVAPPPTSNVIPASVLQNIKDLNATILKNSQAISTLNSQSAATQKTLRNHTLEIGDLHVEVNSLLPRIQNVTQLANSVYNSLQTFNGKTLPAIRGQVSSLKNSLTSSLATVKNLQTGQLALTNSTVFIRSDLSSLQKSVTQGQGKQDQAILKYARGIASTLGSNRQVRTQLQTLQSQLQQQLSPNAIVPPPLINPPRPPTISPG